MHSQSPLERSRSSRRRARLRAEIVENRAPRIVFFTGAGISAESGIPTFRDAGGLWEGMDPNVVASYANWKSNYELVHRFYSERRLSMSQGILPNAAHRALADWQRRYNATMITQNIDSLLELAGCTDVMHVHGRIQDMRCIACGTRWSITQTTWNPEADRCPQERCRSRKGVKPDVIFFGERSAWYKQMYRTLEDLGPNDMLVSMGTSGIVIRIGEIARSLSCRRIFNALEADIDSLDPKTPVRREDFDRFIFEPASSAIASIDAELVARYGQSLPAPTPEALPSQEPDRDDDRLA